MDKAAASFVLTLYMLLVTSSPAVNAAPAGSSATSTVTNRIQTAVNQLISEAQQNVQQELKSALRDLVQRRINALSSHAHIELTDEFIQLTADPAATLNLFSFLSGGSDAALPITLEQVTYRFESSELTVITRGYGSQIVIPDLLQLQDVGLSMTVNLEDVNTLAITFTGDWVIDATTISLQVVYRHESGDIHLTAQLTESISVNDLLSAVGVDVSSIPLPPGIGGFPQLMIDSFVLDLQARTILVTISYPNSLTYFDGFLRVDNPMLIINASRQGVEIDVDGDLSISGSGFAVTIDRDEASNNYILTANADELPITNLVNQFQSEVLPSELNSLLSSLPFFSFSIDDPSISFPLSSSPLQIQLGGTPVIAGYNTVHMASIIIRQGGKTLLVQGFELGSVNLATFLRSITGLNFNTIALLNQDLDAAILISPVTLPNLQLTGNKLSGFSVNKGVSVQASMQFPPDCSSDAFCAVAAALLGEDAQLSLQGTIASAASFTLFAGVANINLGGGIVMSEAGVEIRGGAVNSIGIVGAIDLSNPDITLAARIALSTSGVVLEMTMSGCWENAFGASWLDICNLQSSVAMIPGLTLTGLALGGEVHIGDDTCGTPLVATGFVGIDVLTPSQNYYYVNLQGSTTVGTILDALCISVNVPAPLAESGFPHGFMASFSLFGVELPHVPLSIPLGYRFSGTLNILGLEASANVTIGLPEGIDFAVSLPPIHVGGQLLEMYASISDQSRGPFLRADIDLLPTPSVDIQASGYLSVLGISLDTTMRITNTHYLFDIQGNMLGLFQANLHIAASYGSIHDARFRVRGSFTNNLYGVIENRIRSTLEGAAQEASEAFDVAQRGLDTARNALNRANRELERGRDEVRRAQAAFDDAVNEVANLRRRVDSVCSTRSCGSVCVGCPDGFTCCGTVWGTCVCYRPKWNGCCTRIPDPACEAENAACVALKEPIRLALRGAEGLVASSRHTLEVANAGITILQQGVSGAELGLRGAQEAVDGVERAYAAGLQAANFIARLSVNGLISIRRITFDVELDAAARGSFSGSVTARFAGAAETTVSLNINLYDITSMARQLAGRIGAGLSSLF